MKVELKDLRAAQTLIDKVNSVSPDSIEWELDGVPVTHPLCEQELRVLSALGVRNTDIAKEFMALPVGVASRGAVCGICSGSYLACDCSAQEGRDD